MEIRVLGAHMLESRDTRHTCFLIDNVMALDAGSLASALTVSEQAKVAAVLLTHRHFDHIRDLPTLRRLRTGRASRLARAAGFGSSTWPVGPPPV